MFRPTSNDAVARRLSVTAVIGAASLLTVAGCAEGSGSGSETTELTFAYTVDAAHANHVCAAEPFAAAVEEASGGSLTLTLYPGGQLGTEVEIVDSLLSGDVDLGFPNPGHLAPYYEPLSVLVAGFLFEDYDNMLEVSRGEVGQELWAGLNEATGLEVLDVWPFGVRQVTTNGVAARTPDDLAGVKMRAPDSPIWIANIEALGATPTPMALEELYTALQQGVVQAQENPLEMVEAQGYDEVQDYVIMTGHVVQGMPVVVNGDAWDGLDDEQRDILVTAAQDAAAEVQECLENELDELIDSWTSAGTVEIVDDVDRDAFRARAAEVLLPRFSDEWEGFYERILQAQGVDVE